MNRRVVHTHEQNDTLWCGEPGGCDGHIKNPISSTRIIPSLVRLESGPIRTLRCEMATHLVSGTARTLAQIAIRILVHTHVPNVDL